MPPEYTSTSFRTIAKQQGLIRVERDIYSGDMEFVQRRIETDRVVKFGPLNCKMSDLIDRGYYLRVRMSGHQTKYNCRLKLHLIGERNVYKLATVRVADMYGTGDLTKFVGAHRDMLRYETQLIEPPMNPMDALLQKYGGYEMPRMIGNMTEREYIRETLQQLIKSH